MSFHHFVLICLLNWTPALYIGLFIIPSTYYKTQILTGIFLWVTSITLSITFGYLASIWFAIGFVVPLIGAIIPLHTDNSIYLKVFYSIVTFILLALFLNAFMYSQYINSYLTFSFLPYGLPFSSFLLN